MTNEEWAMEIQAGRAGYGELWEQVRRFIRLQAYKYQTLHAGLCERAGVELDDLLQCGFLALRDAVEAYDPERGYKLPTYIRYPLQNRFHDATGIWGNRKRDPLNLAVRLDASIGDEDGDATLGEQTADERAEADREAVEDRIFREQPRQRPWIPWKPRNGTPSGDGTGTEKAWIRLPTVKAYPASGCGKTSKRRGENCVRVHVSG